MSSRTCAAADIRRAEVDRVLDMLAETMPRLAPAKSPQQAAEVGAALLIFGAALASAYVESADLDQLLRGLMEGVFSAAHPSPEVTPSPDEVDDLDREWAGLERLLRASVPRWGR